MTGGLYIVNLSGTWYFTHCTLRTRAMHAALLAAFSLLAADPIAADLVLHGGTIYDGSNSEGLIGDVAIQRDRIVGVGKFDVAGSPRVIDCKGLIVAPGFIDLHSHSDSGIVQPNTRQNANFLM